MAQQSTGIVRPVISLVCGVLAVVLMPLSLLAVWATVMLTRTPAFVDAMSPVVRQPQVQDAVVEGIVTGVLGSSGLQPAIAGAVEEPLRQVARSVVTDPRVATAWTGALGVTHRQLVRVLQGRAETGLDSQGRVTLRLPVELPELESTLSSVGVTDPSVLRPTVEIPLVAASDLRTAKRVYAVADAVGVWAPTLVAALALLAVALARWHRRALGWIATGWLLGAGALAAALLLGRAPLVDQLREPVVRALSDTAYGISATWLYTSCAIAAGVALVLLVLTAISGRSRRR
ncbi:MAG: integral rane protein [Humibacillus sp.]|nr:integral rane protein [Humibacillus sp.]